MSLDNERRIRCFRMHLTSSMMEISQDELAANQWVASATDSEVARLSLAYMASDITIEYVNRIFVIGEVK